MGILATVSLIAYDNLDINGKGNAWIATLLNSVMGVTAKEMQINIAGDGKSTDVLQSTATRFGRSSW